MVRLPASPRGDRIVQRKGAGEALAGLWWARVRRRPSPVMLWVWNQPRPSLPGGFLRTQTGPQQLLGRRQDAVGGAPCASTVRRSPVRGERWEPVALGGGLGSWRACCRFTAYAGSSLQTNALAWHRAEEPLVAAKIFKAQTRRARLNLYKTLPYLRRKHIPSFFEQLPDLPSLGCSFSVSSMTSSSPPAPQTVFGRKPPPPWLRPWVASP